MERKSFTPKRVKKAIETRKKMEKEVVKQTVKESQKPMTKKIRNLTIKLVPVEEKKSVAQTAKEGLGLFFNTKSKFNEDKPTFNTKVTGRNPYQTARQRRIEQMYLGSGNVGGWY